MGKAKRKGSGWQLAVSEKQKAEGKRRRKVLRPYGICLWITSA
jgi:hypothetical protein